MRRAALSIAATFCLLLAAAHAAAQSRWAGVRSQNFLLVGDAGEREMRRVAEALGRFREVLPRALPKFKHEPRVPTTVLVFRDEEAYRPFKPLFGGRPADVSGFFQSGQDVNYITLDFGAGAGRALRTLRHEYVHLMVKNNLGASAPPWFEEGLAEVYSRFEVDGRRASVGGAADEHLSLLGRHSLMPLKTLFETDGDALRRDEGGARRLFYAQSWALVHYLVIGDGGRRLGQTEKFLDLVRAGAGLEESFREAFQTNFAAAEAALENYIRRESFRAQEIELGREASDPTEPEVTLLGDAEVEAHLGDLLLHMGRLEEAEARLLRALSLDPESGAALASLGMLRVRQGRFAEAREHLRRAVRLSAQNYLAHYYYAFALSREADDGTGYVNGFGEEALGEMRAALRASIELRPDFPESQAFLAWVNMIASERLDEAAGLIERARTLSPGKPEHLLVLAQIQLRRERFDEALGLLAPLAADAEPTVRERAERLIEAAGRMRERARERARAAQAEAEYAGMTEDEVIAHLLRKALRKPLDGEVRARGLLTGVECVAGGVVFHVRVGDRLMRLRDEDFAGIHLVTYAAGTGRKLACGPRAPENHVVVTYRPRGDAGAATDGEIVAVEFVPAAFKLSPDRPATATPSP